MGKSLVWAFVWMLVLPLFWSGDVLAHPQPLVVQEFTWEIAADEVILDYKAKINPVDLNEAYTLWDKDGDGVISEAENDLFITEKLLPNIVAKLDGNQYTPTVILVPPPKKNEITTFDDAINYRLKFVDFEYSGPEEDIPETEFSYTKIDFSLLSELELSYSGLLYPDDPFGDRIVFNFKIGEGEIVEVKSPEYTIRPYQKDLQLKYPDLESRRDDVVEGDGSRESDQKEVSESKNVDSWGLFKSLFVRDNGSGSLSSQLSSQYNELSFFEKVSLLSSSLSEGLLESKRFWLVTAMIAFVAGALHAVTPGHGKSFMAAFLVGKGKSKFSDVLVLGASITVAHTAVIFILGFILLVLELKVSINQLLPYFEKFAGILLLLIGWNLLNEGLKKRKDSQQADTHSHGHSHDVQSKKDLFVAGLSGGIVPCLDALSILIVAAGLGKILFGLFLVLCFSLGLAVAIVFIGMLFVLGKNRFDPEKKFGKVAAVYAPIVSGVIILLLSLRFIF